MVSALPVDDLVRNTTPVMNIPPQAWVNTPVYQAEVGVRVTARADAAESPGPVPQELEMGRQTILPGAPS
jgi:hypothetical protein